MEIVQVAAVNPLHPTAGGIRSHVLGLSTALAKLGHRVTVVGPGPEVPTSGVGWRFLSVTPRFPVESATFLLRLFQVARRLPLAGTILHVHRPDDLAALLLRRDMECSVVTIHGMPGQGIRSRHGPFAAFAYRRLETVGLGLADRIIVLDRDTQSSLTSRGPSLQRKVVRGWAGVDLDTFSPVPREAARAAIGIPNRPTVAFVGRLVPEKNLSILLEACKRIPDVQLLLAGDGPGRGQIQQEGEGAPWIHYFSTVDRNGVAQILNAADVVALPSHREAMPAAAIESLACGTPVVASAVGGLRELIRDGNGFLSPPSAEGFADKLRAAIRHSGEMRTECRASVTEFGWDAVAAKTLQLYQEALN